MRIVKPGKVIITENKIVLTEFHFDNEGNIASKWTYRAMHITASIWATWQLLKGMFQKYEASANHFVNMDGNFIEAP